MLAPLGTRRNLTLWAFSPFQRQTTVPFLPTATRFGLTDRGFVREGYCADLVLFNADTVRDVADFKEPKRAAEGIDAVWVNGHLSYAEGKPQGERQGRFLPRSGSLMGGFS